MAGGGIVHVIGRLRVWRETAKQIQGRVARQRSKKLLIADGSVARAKVSGGAGVYQIKLLRSCKLRLKF